ncbi:hypothetical protein KFL_001390110 [Klebsormidium nitens]|uniref:Uncharacterized protein n=1 Tax=Klebsormidium nitens TaxID=105231 RepID=A0A1Y1HYE5_KLENI|nr:hypothetical protein KFL_001390110 [Klebsormidium nitens]|eukprot:GAQ83193.1 hypothetical protein KFL_001390110 [Klebsormidium nitens]
MKNQRELFKEAAEYFQRDSEKLDLSKTPDPTHQADSALLREIFVKLSRSGAEQAGRLLDFAAKQLRKCTAEQAASLITEGAASVTLRALGLTVPKVSLEAGAKKKLSAERSAIVRRALDVLGSLFLTVDKRKKPSLQGPFLTTSVGLLEWTSAVKLLDRNAGFVGLDEKLESYVYNSVLALLKETEIWDRRKLPERMQMHYVDLAVSAIKLDPFSDTASIAWANLTSLKSSACYFRSSSVTITSECLWHPGSEPLDPALESPRIGAVCMQNAGRIFYERGLLSLGLDKLQHVLQSYSILFGIPRCVLSVLQACCLAAPIKKALLPKLEIVIQTLDSVRDTMIAAFGAFGPFDGPPLRDYIGTTGEEILNEAMCNVSSILDAFLETLDDPATEPKLRRQVLLRSARANGPALCAKVLRDVLTFQAALPDKAAEQQWVPATQRVVRRLWEVQALEFGLKACSNPGCEDKLVEESKGTFQRKIR